jgi:hypothetical protein
MTGSARTSDVQLHIGESLDSGCPVIASEAKQSILFLRGEMDCFASLAMTLYDALLSMLSHRPGMTKKRKPIARRANQVRLSLPPCPAPSEKIFRFALCPNQL